MKKNVLRNAVTAAALLASVFFSGVCVARAQQDTGVSSYSANEERVFLDDLRNEDISYYKELMELRKKYPRIYKKVILGEIRKQRILADMRDTNPEIYKKLLKTSELEKKLNDLIRHYGETDGNERKAEIKNEVKNLLYELFDLREEKYNVELKELEDQIKVLKTKMARRKDNKDRIVNKRLENMLSSDETSEW
jgi:hypothetical protein